MRAGRAARIRSARTRPGPVPAIVHKYPDRVLFLALDSLLGLLPPLHAAAHHQGRRGGARREPSCSEGIDYVRAHPEVRDVLISGGDPFLLSRRAAGGAARAAARDSARGDDPHRHAHAGVPADAGDRRAGATLLRRYAPLFVVTHFNHPKEITPEAREACERLVDHGVPVENQAVLMRRVNSSARIIKELSHALPDDAGAAVLPAPDGRRRGARAPAHAASQTGVEILEQLRGHTTGLAVPHLAVDLPGGGGKVTLQPDYVSSGGERETVFRNYQGERYALPRAGRDRLQLPVRRGLAGAVPGAGR